MKSVTKVLLIGLIITFINVVISLNIKDFIEMKKYKDNSSFVGKYEYIEYDKNNKKYKQKIITFKDNNECEVYSYHNLESIRTTNIYDSNYCKYDYIPIYNTIYIEFDDKNNYNERNWIDVKVDGRDLIWGSETLNKK